MDNKERIKLKIKALLAKTTENGATESEMLEAMAKASELMEKYYINENDINDPFLGEKCVFGKTAIIKCKYTIDYFYPFLGKLFDCEHYYTSKELTFFGFENDVELCLFFYNQIVKTCFSEANKYRDSREISRHQIQTGRHKKTLISSFMKGFILRVCEKLDHLYRERQAERTTERGLVLRSKSQKVKDAFQNERIFIIEDKPKIPKVSRVAMEAGEKAGENFSLTQGIKQGKQQSQKVLGRGQNGN